MLKVVDECDGWWVFDKPPSLDMHDNDGVPGLVSVVKAEFASPAYPVHRLDKDTSGLVLVAKSSTAASRLSTLFAEKRIEKFYWAIAQGKPRKKQGAIVGDMLRSRRGQWRLSRTRDNPAITQFFSYSLKGQHQGKGARAYALKPHTGKTHQLRVALKSLGVPITGDTRYSGFDADRLFLHASELKFSVGGEDFFYRCPPSQGSWFEEISFQNLMRETGAISALAWPGVAR